VREASGARWGRGSERNRGVLVGSRGRERARAWRLCLRRVARMVKCDRVASAVFGSGSGVSAGQSEVLRVCVEQMVAATGE
jgi:hypothetical protein